MPIKVRERERNDDDKDEIRDRYIITDESTHENKKEMRKTTTVYNRRGNYHNILNSYE